MSQQDVKGLENPDQTNASQQMEGQPWFAWQDGYYDSVIRTEAALQQIRRYIRENPMRWSQDKLFKRY